MEVPVKIGSTALGKLTLEIVNGTYFIDLLRYWHALILSKAVTF